MQLLKVVMVVDLDAVYSAVSALSTMSDAASISAGAGAKDAQVLVDHDGDDFHHHQLLDLSPRLKVYKHAQSMYLHLDCSQSSQSQHPLKQLQLQQPKRPVQTGFTI
jgi:hypothetical protein